MSIDFTRIRHFRPDEFVRPDLLRWEMLKKLEDLREYCGFPFIISSSYREPNHNQAVGGAKDSAHLPDPGDGQYSGVDIDTQRIGGSGLFILIKGALGGGFNRIGIYPKHVHLDVESRLPQQVIWVGKD